MPADLNSVPTDLVDELKSKVATACRILHVSGLAPDYQGHASARVPDGDRPVTRLSSPESKPAT